MFDFLHMKWVANHKIFYQRWMLLPAGLLPRGNFHVCLLRRTCTIYWSSHWAPCQCFCQRRTSVVRNPNRGSGVGRPNHRHSMSWEEHPPLIWTPAEPPREPGLWIEVAGVGRWFEIEHDLMMTTPPRPTWICTCASHMWYHPPIPTSVEEAAEWPDLEKAL
jgi:hypothetical protein